MQPQMLAPAAVLAAWSLIVLVWLVIARFGAAAKSGLDLKSARPGGRGQDLEGVLPDNANWKAHNYTHLMEQPTLFYAVTIIVALSGATPADVALAWAYVGLRVIHSIWQATVNRIPLRLMLFALSTLCLACLTIRAIILTVLG